jgi:DNA-binding transcriptional ArsR family regulator
LGEAVLRVHFTTEDRGRVEVARSVDPMWEMVFSRLRLYGQDRTLRPWARWVRRDVGIDAVKPGLRVLHALSPVGPYFPDFLTPAEGESGLAAAVAAIKATPRDRIRRELGLLSTAHAVPAWAASLAEGDRNLLAALGNSLTAYHRSVIEPYGDTIAAAVEADRAHRARAMLNGGVDGLLLSMRPLMCWQSPVLEVSYAVHRDLHLNGRGLRMVPSYFCRGTPVALADPTLPPILVYPIHQPDCADAIGNPGLAALLGSTRYAVLSAIGYGATTTELARRLGVTASSVSRHTTVLRQSGIIRTHRHGPSVLHTKTPLGAALLSTAVNPR